jgi:predicted dehydrogenase
MMATAQRTGKVLIVGHTLRFDPRYRAVHDAIAAGRLGRIQSLSCRRAMWTREGIPYAMRTNLPLCLGVHDLDIARWCAGEIVRVYAEPGPSLLAPPTADSITATLRFESGATGVLELAWNLPEASAVAWDTHFVCVGTERSAYLELRGGANVGDSGDLVPELTYMYEVDEVPGGVVAVMDRLFLRELREPGSWPGGNLEDARRAVELALAITESASSGRPVDVPPSMR